MATVIRLGPLTLSVGESASASWAPTSDLVSLAATTQQVGAVVSQVRIIARDARGQTLGSAVLDGSDAHRMEPIEGIEGNITLEVVGMRGVANFILVEVTGATALGGGVTTADCVAPLLAASVAGRALMADDYFTTAEMVAGAGGKFAAGCLDETGVTNVIANTAIPTAKLKRDVAGGALITADATGRALIADDTFTTAEFAAGAGGKFAPGALNTAGLANTIADDGFTAAEFAAGAGGKFAANCLVTAGIQNLFADDSFTAAEFAAGAGGKFAPGCLTSATIQNLFAAGSMDGAACAALFAAAAIPIAAVAAAPLAIETVIADPGAGANIVVTGSGHCNINIAAPADNRGLPIPTIDGQAILIVHTAGANAGTVTSAQALDPRGTTVINFAAELGQWILLIGRNNGAALRWQVVAQGGGVTTSTPVYGPNAIADPGAGNAIAVTTNGRCTFTIAAPADNRTLAAPTWEGQTIVLESLAASAAGTVTIATGFSDGGATVLYFMGGVNERVWLFADLIAGALRWRVGKADALTHVDRNIPDPGNAGAIEVLHDDGYMSMNILGGGHDRTLAVPTFYGQRLTIVHNAGANAGTVTCAQDITDVGGQNVINFTAALGEMITLEAVDFGVGLRWRIAANPDALVIS